MDILLKENVLRRARLLHQQNPVVDAHFDLPGELLLRHKRGERDIIRRDYLEKWKRTGLKLLAASVFVPTAITARENPEGILADVLVQIEALFGEMQGIGQLTLVRDRTDLERVLKTDQIGILLYLEGLDCIGEELFVLSRLFEKGVRGAALTWSRKNALATGCCKAGEYKQIPGQITESGRRVIREMERLSMFLDVSHLNDEGFGQVLAIAKKPFLATHSGSRSVYDNYRNLTDEQMILLSGQGGVMGLNGCKLIAGSISGNHLEMLCKHAEYETKLIGAGHVGLGLDFCDAYDRAAAAAAGKMLTEEMDCLRDHTGLILLTAALLQRGMAEMDVIAIMGESMLRYFRAVLPGGA